MEVTEHRKAALQLPREAGLSAASGRAARRPRAVNPSVLLDNKGLLPPHPHPSDRLDQNGRQRVWKGQTWNT